MVHKRFEITVIEPIYEIESLVLVLAAERKKWDIHIVNSGRIMVLEGPKTIKTVIKFLTEVGFNDDVGLIKEITEYEPDYYTKDLIAFEEPNPEEGDEL